MMNEFDVDNATREFLESHINRVSYLTIRPQCGGEWSKICVNAGTDHCRECQQEECDAAGGGIPDESEYKWIIVRKEIDKNERT